MAGSLTKGRKEKHGPARICPSVPPASLTAGTDGFIPDFKPMPNRTPPAAEPILYVRADRAAWDFHNLVSAPMTELFQFKELIRNIIARDLKVRYKRSVLGILWTVFAPLMQMLVMWVVFKQAFKVTTPYYAAYLFSGIIAWNLFTQSSSAGTASIFGASGLITKIKLPRVIFPLTAVFNNLINFFFAFVALLLVMALSRAPFHGTLVLVPFMILPLLIFSMGWAMLVSAVMVFFRDVQYFLEIGLGALFYLTPIMWEPSAIPAQYHWILSVNPMAKYIHIFRQAVYSGQLPSLQTYLLSLSISVAMFLVGWIVFQRLQRKFLYWL
jgi:ABC-type polysaccharide/polyol phosphate export permease